VNDVAYVPKPVPYKGQRQLPQVQSIGGTPLENLIIYFTEMPQSQGCKYLLMFICTFSGWVEDFHTWTENAQEVARCLLKEIIPCFGIPLFIGLDNGQPLWLRQCSW
jgi:hypothetical protein